MINYLTNINVQGTVTISDLLTANGGINLTDNLLNFGTGNNDMSMFHTGSHGYIDMDTGSFYIRGASNQNNFIFTQTGNFNLLGGITAVGNISGNVITSTQNVNVGNDLVVTGNVYAPNLLSLSNADINISPNGTGEINLNKDTTILGLTVTNNITTATGTITGNSFVSNTQATANNQLVRLDQLNSIVGGLDWQESVLDQLNLVTSEPASPTVGDRYISLATGTSSVTSQAVTIHYIYEWNGTDWTEFIPNEGWTVWIEDIDTNYTYNGSTWVEFGSTVSHNNTTGLQGGQASQYYHLNLSDYTNLTADSANLAYTNVDNNFSVHQNFNNAISVYGAINLKSPASASAIGTIRYVQGGSISYTYDLPNTSGGFLTIREIDNNFTASQTIKGLSGQGGGIGIKLENTTTTTGKTYEVLSYDNGEFAVRDTSGGVGQILRYNESTGWNFTTAGITGSEDALFGGNVTIDNGSYLYFGSQSLREVTANNSIRATAFEVLGLLRGYGNLTISGITTLNGLVDINNNVDITGTLDVSGRIDTDSDITFGSSTKRRLYSSTNEVWLASGDNTSDMAVIGVSNTAPLFQQKVGGTWGVVQTLATQNWVTSQIQTVDTLQEVTDNGATTTNTIEITKTSGSTGLILKTTDSAGGNNSPFIKWENTTTSLFARMESSGDLKILNNGFASNILTLTQSGDLTVTGRFTSGAAQFWGSTTHTYIQNTNANGNWYFRNDVNGGIKATIDKTGWLVVNGGTFTNLLRANAGVDVTGTLDVTGYIDIAYSATNANYLEQSNNTFGFGRITPFSNSGDFVFDREYTAGDSGHYSFRYAGSEIFSLSSTGLAAFKDDVDITGTLDVTDGTDTTSILYYGIEFDRTTSYLRPTQQATKNLYIGGFSQGVADWENIFVWTNGSNDFKWNDEIVATQTWVGDNVTEVDKALSLTLRVKNTESIALSKGQVVCAAPSATPPSGNVIEVKLADNNGTDSMPAIGILNEDLDAAGGANDEGEAIMFGRISGIDTSAFSVGDEVFVSDTAGGLTTTKPTGVKYIQKVGVVMRDSASNGTIEVFGAGRTNDVPTPLYVDHTNQRLGIGTTSPSFNLHVLGTEGGDGTYDGGILIENNNTSSDGEAALAFRVNSMVSSNRYWFTGLNQSSNYKIGYGTGFLDSDTFFTITNTGNVGIGTSSPSAPLHIVENSTNDAVVIETTEDSSTAGPVICLKRNSSSPDDGDYLGQIKFLGENDADQQVMYAKITAKTSDVTDTTEDGLFEFAVKKAGSNAIVARLTHSDLKLINGTGLQVDGDVGIGTTSPEVKTHIYNEVDGTFTGLAIDNRKTYGVGTGTNETSRLILSLSEGGQTNPTSRVMGYLEAGTLSETSSSDGFLSLGTREGSTDVDYITLNGTGTIDLLKNTEITGTLDVTGDGHFNWTSASNFLRFSRTNQNDWDIRHQDGGLSFYNSSSTFKSLQLIGNELYSRGVHNFDNKVKINHDGGHTSGTVSYTHAAIDLYNPVESNVAEKGSILTFSDNYYDGTNYNRTTRAGIKGGTQSTGNTANGFLAFYTDSSSANSLEERMRIDKDGNVGIGTTSSNGTLNIRSVSSTGSDYNLLSQNNSGTQLFYVRNDGVVNVQNNYLYVSSSQGAYFEGSVKARGGVTDDNGTLGLGGGGSTNHLNILTSGNVGIGTASPLNKLQIGEYVVGSNGTQNVSGIASIFANSGATALHLGLQDSSYPNRGWSFEVNEVGVNSNLVIKEHGLSGDRIQINSGGRFNILGGGLTVQDSTIKVGSSTGANAVDSGTIDFLENTDADFGSLNGYGFRLNYNGDTNDFTLQSGSDTTVTNVFRVDRGSTATFEILRNTDITGTLDVSGVITGNGSGLTNVNADTLDSLLPSQFLRSDVNDTFAGSQLSINNTLRLNSNLKIFVSGSDNAHQRADARTEDTNKARLHWYGRNTADDANDRFRQAWYNGSKYYYVDAHGDGIKFGNSTTTDGDFFELGLFNSTNLENLPQQWIRAYRATTFGQGSVAIGVGNADRLTIDYLGNVGIGATPSTSHKFVVAGDIVSTNGKMYLSSGNQIYFDYNGSNDYAIRKSASDLAFTSGGDFTFNSNIDIEDDSPFLTIRGTNSSYSNAGIQLISGNASNNRALGVFHYVENSDVEWFAGLPYGGNDAYVINRNTGYTSPSSQSSPVGIGASQGRLFTITNSGNVGIGTDTPDFKLDVAGDIGIDGKIYHNGDHNTYIGFGADTQTFRTAGVDALTIDSVQDVILTEDLRFSVGKMARFGGTHLIYFDGSDTYHQQTSGGMYYYNNADTHHTWHNNSAQRMRLEGTGTESDPVLLRIHGEGNNTNDDSKIILSQGNSGSDLEIFQTGTNTRTDGLTANDQYIRSGQRLNLWNRSNGSAWNTKIQLGYGYISFGTNAVNSDASTRMIIDSSGNVGIGTTSPSSKLHIAYTGTGGTGIFGVGEGLKIQSLSPNITFDDTSNNIDSYAIHLNQNVFTLGRYTSSTSMDSDLVLKQGSVGIGTASPGAYKFRVNGTSKFDDAINVDGQSIFNDPLTIQSTVASGVANANLIIYNDINGVGAGIKFSDQSTTQSQYGTFKFFHGDTSFAGVNNQVHWKFESNQGSALGLNLPTGGMYSIGSDIGIFQDGNNLFLRNSITDGDIFFQSDDGAGGNSTYYYIDGGNLLNRFTKSLMVEDNQQIIIGTGLDLTLFHESASSTTFLDINTNALKIRDASNVEKYRFNQNGNLQLDSISVLTGQQLVLNAGESVSYATGQTGENVYVNAEYGLQINASPDNWATGWAGRVTHQFSANDITLRANTTIDKNEPWFTLKSSQTGSNTVEQAAGISLGESGTKGTAAVHITYTGDGKGWLGMGAVTDAVPAYKALTMRYNEQRVGIGGDYNGSYNVNINGTTNVTSNLTVAGTGTFNKAVHGNNISTTTSEGAYNITRTFTNSRTGSARALADDTIWSSNVQSLGYAGWDNRAQFNNCTFNHHTAFQSRPRFDATTITDYEGVYIYGDYVHDSTITNWKGVIVDTPYTFDNTDITNFIGLEVKAAAGTNGATITNFYGMYIGNGTVTATNKYAIFSDDATVDVRVDGEIWAGTFRAQGEIYSPNTSTKLRVGGETSSLYLEMNAIGSTATFNDMNLKVDKELESKNQKTTQPTANNEFNGEIVYFGTGTLTAGNIVMLNSSGAWVNADASAESTSNGMLGIALGTSPSDGILIKGYARKTGGGFSGLTTGAPVFLSETAGSATNTSPTATNTIVRVLGYRIGTSTDYTVYFEPDRTWIKNL